MNNPVSALTDHAAPTYRERADEHRPDAAGIAAAIRKLAASGLKPHDIAATLRIGVGAVQQVLQQMVVCA